MKAIGAAGLSAAVTGCLKATTKDSRPNIILCLIDDMGKEGVGCYTPSKPSLTPILDQLAAKGMRFDNYYTMPQCTPTRVALLTGQYPFRNGWVDHYDVPRWNLKGFNPKNNPCMGTVMKSAGYETCIAGKWQISDFRREPDILNQCGFDEYCAWTGGESNNEPSDRRYWDPYIHTKDGSKTYKGEYGPDIFNSFIIDFIDRHKNKPMFIYYPMVLRHDPLEKQPLGNLPEEYIDYLIGKIEDSLKKNNIADKTILIFTTDNGLHKGKTDELGVCVPLIIHCPGIVPEGIVTDALVDVTDFLPTFAELAGAKLPKQYEYDGKSFAEFLCGKSKDSHRQWIMAMGGGECIRPAVGEGPFEGMNHQHYRDRVIRDKRYKVYVNTEGRIETLIDLQADPQEKNTILNTDDPRSKQALQKFENVLKSFPCKDENPRYNVGSAS
jgi:arylsulfatase A-like enzyme